MNVMAKVALAVSAIPLAALLAAEPVSVRYPEAEGRANLELRSPDGVMLAEGQWTKTVSGADVTSRVVFHFRDGSLHDETVVFSQDGRFRVLRDRLVQRGPAFPRDVDLSIDSTTGDVSVVSRERNGKATRYADRMTIPRDLVNGIIATVLKNARPEAPPRSASLLVATPAPRIVQLVPSPARREHLSNAGGGLASHYVLKVEIGGLTGRLAALFGKQPPDSHVWIADGNPPVYVRSDQPFYVGGPLWRIDVLR